MKIELTEQIVNILQGCSFGEEENDYWANGCFEHCPLAGACLEYYTGDNSENH